jgi:hypothetical protein
LYSSQKTNPDIGYPNVFHAFRKSLQANTILELQIAIFTFFYFLWN